ncbi:hypothetical protein SASPL_138042 [Salvia splendens]|uniref:4-alpha-glucanotransferase n=1 Tax=Salvia splendens TaxID=180675 RepID=A0A8X8WUS3_SALSN|nr:hypothetical protein SASPL_138042 [Salvia splendens]
MAIPTSLSLLPVSLSIHPKPFLHNHNPPTPNRIRAQFQNGASLSPGEDLPSDYETWMPKRDAKTRRRAGILLHPTSFPGPFGIGDLGPQAFHFVDWLHHAGCSVWQVLPLVPPGRRANEEGSPYSGQDANCGNTLLISLEELVKDGLLSKEDLPKPLDTDRVNYTAVADVKEPLVAEAAKRLISSEGELKNQLNEFRKDPSIAGWLEDAAYFAAVDDAMNTSSWYEWPEPLKHRHVAALEEIYQSKKEFVRSLDPLALLACFFAFLKYASLLQIDIFIAQQFLFQRQWQKVRDYAQMKGISIMGDMPIYVGYHSADVWANKKQFLLNRSGFPLLVSGVPPDAFSETGQLWNSECSVMFVHPSYNDRKLLIRVCDENDLVGFSGFWAVPSEAKVATVGRWKVGPGKSLFDAIFRDVGEINIIAEDLGVITEDVVALRRSIGAPGMAVLQFGFGSDAENPHLPHNHEENQVVYTGTHDNDTIQGWWDVLPEEEKSNVVKYLGHIVEEDVSWGLIKAALSSVSQTTIIPMQDILKLGSSARMNTPATQFGNWSWRVPQSTSFDSMSSEAERLREMLLLYGRM